MEINRDRFNDVCRFGPGGDFVWCWPSGDCPQAMPANKLSAVLAKLSRIMNAAIGQASGRSYVEVGSDTIIVQEVKDGYSQGGFEGALNAKTGRVAQVNSGFSAEPLLFADDRGACRPDGCKPKHSVRAYRRASRKRASLLPVEQGTLFGSYLEGAQTA
jgi:streptogramin lyase